MYLSLGGLVLSSLMVAYVLSFQSTTLEMGRSLTDATVAGDRGLQDAITPPWVTTLFFLSFASFFGSIGYLWYAQGWMLGIGSIVGGLLAISISQVVILPKSGSQHYKDQIYRSMLNRYANYAKSGDTVRADAMAHLLEISGVPVPKR